jgi:cytidylate kinase
VIVAIDGPAGAGKSTVARAVARAVGFDYLDTGAMYRAAALAVLNRGVSPADEPAVAELVRSASIGFADGRVMLDGADVSDRIRAADVTAIVSTVAANEGVRNVLGERQRELARQRDVVMEGRDIGSVVVPDAEVKIFLTASIEERARRRAAQLGRPIEAAESAAMKTAIAERDERDATRAVAPLVKPRAAVVVDSTNMDEAEVVERIVELVKARGTM